MKKIIAAVLAAATFASTLSFGISAATPIDSGALSSGSFDITSLSNVYVADGNKVGDVVKPGKSVFIMIDQTTATYGDATADPKKFDYSVKVVEGAKYVSGKTAFVGKNDFKAEALAGGFDNEISGRESFVEVKLKDNYTDAENKIKLELTIKGKGIYSGTVKITSPFIYVGNVSDDGTDQEYAAGTSGKMFKPVANEDNEIVWSDNARDIARLTFFADSDSAKTYPKLNTKWPESDYADYFADQDAFLFEFVSNPYVSSTSRASLEIYNPYYDEDEDAVTVDPADVIIYQIVDDSLVDVTDLFKYGENEDGDLVYTIKTRQLGTYIFAEAEATVETPDDEEIVTPDEIKKPVDTGR